MQSQVARLRVVNEELQRQLGLEVRGDQRMPAELRWLIYFRAPATKVQVLPIVRDGLAALFAKDPLFQGRECATFWAAQERPNWQAFRIDYVGFNLAAFRAAMKAANADAQLQLPANAVRTTQPSSVALYRQVPGGPPVFTGTLEELAGALQDAMEQIFIA